jgi:O-antigen ligase
MLYKFFLAFCVFLPLQFAMNVVPGIDLASVRIIVPILFLVCAYIAIKNKQRLFTREKTSHLLLAFLLLAALSFFHSTNLLWSARKFLFLLSLFPIYVVATFVLNNAEKKRTAIRFLIAGATLGAIIGIVQFLAQFIFGINPVYDFMAAKVAPIFLGKTFAAAVAAYPSWLVNSNGTVYMRAISLFPDPHMLSYYLGMLLPFSIALWATSKKYASWFFVCTLLLATADIITFTRGGYVALIAAAIVVLPLVSKQAAKKIVLGAAIFLLFLFVMPDNPVAGRFESSFDVNEGSNQGRIYNWKESLPIITAHPLGVGIGMYPLYVDPSATYRTPIYAHDLYLDIAAELGIITSVIFIIFLAIVFARFWQAAKLDPFWSAGVASITVFTVHSLVETPLYSVHVLTLLLIIASLSTINSKMGSSKQLEPSKN